MTVQYMILEWRFGQWWPAYEGSKPCINHRREVIAEMLEALKLQSPGATFRAFEMAYVNWE